MLKDTIISAFNYDGTLLKWLKKVEDALQNASASEFRVNKKGNATISFSIVFANGDTLESGDIILQQGESVTGASIRQGHLILTLSNGDELDAGDVGAVTGFSINASQHLIVTYQNGTTQDLGAIFTGDVNINGNLTANSIIEKMSGFYFSAVPNESYEVYYASAVKNGNKITFVVAGVFGNENTDVPPAERRFGNFGIPATIGEKLIPLDSNFIDLRKGIIGNQSNALTDVVFEMWKPNNKTLQPYIFNPVTVPAGTRVSFRYEATFLISDNMIV